MKRVIILKNAVKIAKGGNWFNNPEMAAPSGDGLLITGTFIDQKHINILSINISPHSAAYMRQYIVSALVQITACMTPSHYLNQC